MRRPVGPKTRQVGSGSSPGREPMAPGRAPRGAGIGPPSLERARRLGHRVTALPAPTLRRAPVRPASLGAAHRVQRAELDRLTLTPDFQHETDGEGEAGFAAEGSLYAVNPPEFKASLDYRVQGASRDADGLVAGLVQNATAEHLSALYIHQHDPNTLLARRVTFGPSEDLPLLDSSAGQEPYYDSESAFQLVRPDTADAIDEQITDEITLTDRPNFAIPARFESSQRLWSLVPNTLEGARTLRIWSRFVDKSQTAANAAQLQWSVRPDASISTGAGGGAPVLDGTLASTSELEIQELGGTFEVPQQQEQQEETGPGDGDGEN